MKVRLRLFEAVQRQVESELRDDGRAAPVGVQTGGIVGRDRARVEGGGLRACPNIALGLRQVGVPIANVERKYLPSETDAHIPCRVVYIFETSRKRRRSVESIAVADELLTHLSRHVPADGTQ